MGSFGNAAKDKQDDGQGKDDDFQLLGGTLLIEGGVDRGGLQVLYEQVKDATWQGILDGYAEAACQWRRSPNGRPRDPTATALAAIPARHL